jgi:hypothetical protein
MQDLNWIERGAEKARGSAKDPAVKELAEAVVNLCRYLREQETKMARDIKEVKDRSGFG